MKQFPLAFPTVVLTSLSLAAGIVWYLHSTQTAPRQRHSASAASITGRSVTISSKTLIVGIDASESVRGYLLGPAAFGTCALVSRLDPQDRATIFRVDRTTRRILGPQIPESSTALQQTLLDELSTPTPRSGTLSAEWWEKAADTAANSPGPVAIALYSEGDNDDQRAAANARIVKAARHLAHNKKVVAVCIYGVKKENTAALDRQFSCLGDRFRTYPRTAMEIEWLSQRLEAARG